MKKKDRQVLSGVVTIVFALTLIGAFILVGVGWRSWIAGTCAILAFSVVSAYVAGQGGGSDDEV